MPASQNIGRYSWGASRGVYVVVLNFADRRVHVYKSLGAGWYDHLYASPVCEDSVVMAVRGLELRLSIRNAVQRVVGWDDLSSLRRGEHLAHLREIVDDVVGVDDV